MLPPALWLHGAGGLLYGLRECCESGVKELDFVT